MLGIIIMVLILFSPIYIGTIALYKENRKKYERFVSQVRKDFKYGYATYSDFLAEYIDRRMYFKDCDIDGFYENKDGNCSLCSLNGEIVFDDVFMLLTYKDHKEYMRFIKSEFKKRKEYELDKNNTRKWGR